ncbi:MAG TPA: ATP-binding protein [Solirubrobacteraceae bacterium]|nr:ATP-binding protein [Solirubrobacteraceae bacterium]
MSATPEDRWQEQNRELLVLAVDELHARITDADPEPQRERIRALLDDMDHAPALLSLAQQLDLGPFERDVVLLAFASELDPRFRLELPPVTVGSALELLHDAHWAALDDAAPLRTLGILEAGEAPSLADTPLRLAKDVTRHLMGFDARTGDAAPLTLVPEPPALVTRQIEHGSALAAAAARATETTGEWPAVELHGAQEEDRLAVAFVVGAAFGSSVATVDVRDLPAPGHELDAALRTLSRLGRITQTLLCLTTGPGHEDDPSLRHRLDRAVARLQAPFLLSGAKPSTHEPAREVLRRAVTPLDATERLELWEAFTDRALARLGDTRRTTTLDRHLTQLAADFRLGARALHRATLEAEVTTAAEREEEEGDGVDPHRFAAHLRHACAADVRARLDPLADRIDLTETAEVALPEREARQLAELEMAIRLSEEVSTGWGLGRGRTLGTSALFAGPSGTGKTHAAHALAKRLGLDLYRVDLAGVLSKYIGETERNLDRVFDAAEAGGVVLLFDEADALFGKRSEVRDSHDRYANMGVAYLLARLERTPAPVVLTTNLKDSIDPAFVRRLLIVIDFPFPAEAERAAIWRSVYPPRAPVADLDPEKLARVTATGGTIANIARRGAYLAAAEPAGIGMAHLLEATRRELRKAGRDLTPEELSAWPTST